MICALFSAWQGRILTGGIVKSTLYSRSAKADIKFQEKFGGLGEAVRAAHYPIVTDQCWQFPEVSLFTGVQFYDRMVPENILLLEKAEKVYLLMNERFASHMPYTTKKLCGKIVFEEMGNSSCEYNKQFPFSAIGP